jgi:hypothetical protein
MIFYTRKLLDLIKLIYPLCNQEVQDIIKLEIKRTFKADTSKMFTYSEKCDNINLDR